MDFEKLRTFYTIARTKSFTKAAEELNLTQPAVSSQISSLEEKYGIRLFERIGRKVYLTKAGEVLLPYAEKIIAMFEEAKLAITKIKDPTFGKLNFGASMISGIHIIPGILEEFKRAYPKIETHVRITYAYEILNLIEENEIDFGIIDERGTERAKTIFEIEPLVEDRLILVVHPDHKLAKRKRIKIKELKKENLILTEKRSSLRAFFELSLTKKGLTLFPFMEFGNVEAVKKMVEKGLGVAVLSVLSIKEEVEFGLLKGIEIEDIDTKRSVLLIKRKEKEFFPVTKLFIEYLKRKCIGVSEHINGGSP